MAININDELQKLYQSKSSQAQSLSERLNQYDSQVAPQINGIGANMVDFSNRPVGANPLDSIKMAFATTENARGVRAAASQDLGQQQNQLLALLDKIDTEQRRGSAAASAAANNAKEAAALQSILGPKTATPSAAPRVTTPGGVYGPPDPRTGRIDGMAPAPVAPVQPAPAKSGGIADTLMNIFAPQTKKLLSGETIAKDQQKAATRTNAPGDVKGAIKNAGLDTLDFIKSIIKPGVELGSYTIPFGKAGFLGSKAIVPGAVSGALRGATADNATPLSTAEDALMGGVTGGALQGLGKLVGGAAKGLGITGKAARTAVLNPQAAATPFYKTETGALQNTADSLGLKGSSNRQLDQMPQKFQQIQDTIKRQLSQVTTKVNSKTALKDFNAALDQTNYLPGDSAYEAAKKIFVNKLSKATKGGAEASKLYDLKVDLRSQLANAFKKQDMGNALTPKEDVAMAMFNSLKNTIDRVAPAARPLNTLENQMFDISKGLVKSTKSNMGIPVIGRIPGVNNVAQEAMDAGGRAMQGLTGLSGGSPLAKSLLAMGGVQTAVGMAGNARNQNVQQPNDQQQYDQSLNGGVDNQLGSDTTTSADQSQVSGDQSQSDQLITLPQLYAALLSPDISAGTKTQLKTIYDLQQKENPQSKPLSAQQVKDVNLANNGLRGLDVIKRELGYNSKTGQVGKDATGTISTLRLTPFNMGNRKLYKAMFDAAGARLRIESGAALSPDEIKRYVDQYIGQLGDNPDALNYEIQQLDAFLNGIKNQKSAVPDIALPTSP